MADKRKIIPIRGARRARRRHPSCRICAAQGAEHAAPDECLATAVYGLGGSQRLVVTIEVTERIIQATLAGDAPINRSEDRYAVVSQLRRLVERAREELRQRVVGGDRGGPLQ